MKKTFLTTLRSYASLAFICAASPSTGCLYGGDPGHIASDPDAVATLEGIQVELIRHSPSCDSADSEGLIVEVGPGLEYPADVVGGLKADCALAANPGVEVQIEDHAIVFDFSNITEPGRFADGDFEGYIVNIVRTEDAPMLAAAVVDWHETTMDVVEDDLSYDFEGVTINLANRAFDSNSFLKVDLFLLGVSVPEPGEQM
jgi:hypothetical protein